MSAGVVIALPLVARSVDGSADEFDGRHFSTYAAIGWLVCAVLAAVVVVTRRIQISLAVEEGSGLAITFDALPLLFLGAWIIAVASLLSGHWLLAVAAGGLCLYHLILVVPRLIAVRPPRWTRHAPTIELIVANVYIDNETPGDAARQLVGLGVMSWCWWSRPRRSSPCSMRLALRLRIRIGKGFNPSFELSADGVLGSVGAVARLDHALVNHGMQALAIRNLEPCGSDHLPFKLKVAVRSTDPKATAAARHDVRHDDQTRFV